MQFFFASKWHCGEERGGSGRGPLFAPEMFTENVVAVMKRCYVGVLKVRTNGSGIIARSHNLDKGEEAPLHFRAHVCNCNPIRGKRFGPVQICTC